MRGSLSGAHGGEEGGREEVGYYTVEEGGVRGESESHVWVCG